MCHVYFPILEAKKKIIKKSKVFSKMARKAQDNQIGDVLIYPMKVRYT